jgi:PAS domain S-box-containing protein
MRAGVVAALAVAAALTAASELALQRVVALELVDPRFRAAVGEQRMLAERIAQTGLRAAGLAEPGRTALVGPLESAIARWSRNHAAFRSVAAPAGPPRGFAVQALPEWAALDAAQLRLHEAAARLAEQLRAPGGAAAGDALGARARELDGAAADFVAATERWLAAVEGVRARRVLRERGAHRAFAGGTLASLALAAALALAPAPRPRRAAPLDDSRYRDLVERCPDAVFVVVEGAIAYANPAAAELFGARDRDALAGVPALSLVHPDDRAVVRERLAPRDAGAGREPLEIRILRRDGSERRGLLHAAAVEHEGAAAVEVICADVTERRLAESRLRAAERVESLALMVAGIAHDWNSLLTAIIANAEMLQALVRDVPAASSNVAEILAATDAAAELVGQLLAFAGGSARPRERVDVGELTEETLRLVRRRLPAGVELSFRREAGVPPVHGDRVRLRQVVLNLALNAVEAIREPPGRIEVRVARERLPEGDYVVLEVSDDGVGMDEATRARIFDPFFSTKLPGRGLGLAAALGIVRDHGGAISVESAAGRGARFRVALPPAR